MQELLYQLDLTSDAEPTPVLALVRTAERFCHGAASVRSGTRFSTSVVLNGNEISEGDVTA